MAALPERMKAGVRDSPCRRPRVASGTAGRVRTPRRPLARQAHFQQAPANSYPHANAATARCVDRCAVDTPADRTRYIRAAGPPPTTHSRALSASAVGNARQSPDTRKPKKPPKNFAACLIHSTSVTIAARSQSRRWLKPTFVSSQTAPGSSPT